MRLLRWTTVIFVLALASSGAQAPAGGGGQRAGGPPAPAMTLTSTSFPDGGVIPPKYTQAGDQISPQLTWTNAPPATQSFVLHMHDLEVARNKTTDDQLHWIVWNIPPTVTMFPEGMPQGAELKDGSRQVSASGPMYRGPGAPASGPPHHYTFEIFALDTKIDIQPAADAFETRANVMKAMQGHIIGRAVYMGLFRRPQ